MIEGDIVLAESKINYSGVGHILIFQCSGKDTSGLFTVPGSIRCYQNGTSVQTLGTFRLVTYFDWYFTLIDRQGVSSLLPPGDPLRAYTHYKADKVV